MNQIPENVEPEFLIYGIVPLPYVGSGTPYWVIATRMGWPAATVTGMTKHQGCIGSQALGEAADVLGTSESSCRFLQGPQSRRSLETWPCYKCLKENGSGTSNVQRNGFGVYSAPSVCDHETLVFGMYENVR